MDLNRAYVERPQDYSQNDSLSYSDGAQDITPETWPEKQRRLQQSQERLHSNEEPRTETTTDIMADTAMKIF